MRRRKGEAFALVERAVRKYGPLTSLQIRERVEMTRLDIYTHCERGIEKGIFVVENVDGYKCYKALPKPPVQKKPKIGRVASVWELGR